LRFLALAAALVMLSACGPLCFDDPQGLDLPPSGSAIPAPHG
jgi:hypothetical protein